MTKVTETIDKRHFNPLLCLIGLQYEKASVVISVYYRFKPCQCLQRMRLFCQQPISWHSSQLKGQFCRRPVPIQGIQRHT